MYIIVLCIGSHQSHYIQLSSKHICQAPVYEQTLDSGNEDKNK